MSLGLSGNGDGLPVVASDLQEDGLGGGDSIHEVIDFVDDDATDETPIPRDWLTEVMASARPEDTRPHIERGGEGIDDLPLTVDEGIDALDEGEVDPFVRSSEVGKMLEKTLGPNLLRFLIMQEVQRAIESGLIAEERSEVVAWMRKLASDTAMRNMLFADRLHRLETDLSANVGAAIDQKGKKAHANLAAAHTAFVEATSGVADQLEQVKNERDAAQEAADQAVAARESLEKNMKFLPWLAGAALFSLTASIANSAWIMKGNGNSVDATMATEVSNWNVSQDDFAQTVKAVEDQGEAGLVVNCGSFDPENVRFEELKIVNTDRAKTWMSKHDVAAACEGSTEVKFRTKF